MTSHPKISELYNINGNILWSRNMTDISFSLKKAGTSDLVSSVNYMLCVIFC